LPVEAEEWNRLVIESGAPVYMSYDWCRLWWKHYGKGRVLRVFCFRRKEELVALLPMYIDTWGKGPLKVRLARLVGANIPPKVFDPPMPPGLAEPVFAQVVSRLIRDEGCDVVSLGPLSAKYAAMDALKKIGASPEPPVVFFEDVETEICTLFKLPETYEAYLASLGKRMRRNIRSETRRLRKDTGMHVEIVDSPAEASKEFDAFVDQHTQQWQNLGKPGHFRAWPDAVEYNRALVDAFSRSGRLRFVRMSSNERVLARQYVFSFGDWYFWELAARVFEKEWLKYGLGRVGGAGVMEAAIGEGKTHVQGGLGHYDYKLALGGVEYPVHMMRFWGRRPGGSGRLMFFKAVTFLIDVLYHKIWYKRVQPRLPKYWQRPLWLQWIRLTY